MTLPRAYHFLVSNDDGVQSPFVEPFVNALLNLPSCNTLTAVFPAEEQSWIAQAVTRFRPLHVEPFLVSQLKSYRVTGTPADCVGIGIEHLAVDRPDYVISGINIGTNASLPFYLSSGTLGGARQALCFGIRGIAFSAIVPSEIFNFCREHDQISIRRYASHWERISNVCASLAQKLLVKELWDNVDLYSVNVPWDVDAETEITFTQLERLTYQGLYAKTGSNKYEHHFRGFKQEHSMTPKLPGDLSSVEAGKISITPLMYNMNISNDLLRKLAEEFHHA